MYSSFVSGAQGKRDSYEFALALSQANILKKHVTEIYTPDFFKRNFSNFENNFILKKYFLRNHELLSSKEIYCSKRLLSFLLLRKIFLKNTNIFRNSNQKILGKVVLKLARKYNSAIFLFAGDAFYAFSHDEIKNRLRGLVQYHPHIEKSSEIILADLDKYNYLTNAYDEIQRDMEDKTNILELQMSDKIICHSKFTEETLLYAGISKDKIVTIPYGINPISNFFKSRNGFIKKKNRCNFLFVGQGIHRKGLHHLLLAWKKADLQFSNLKIISRYIDPQIKINAKMTENVYLLENIDDYNKLIEYQKNDVFVMPSLVEGFGYVYLEAFSHGLFCIGTNNSGLKDISSNKTARIINSGDIENLSLILKELQDILLTNGIDKEMIKSSIKKYTWKNYREKVSNIAKKLLNK